MIIKHLHAATVGLISVVRAAVQAQLYSICTLSLSRHLEENSTLLKNPTSLTTGFVLMKPSACFIFLFGSFSPGSNLRNVVWLWMPKPTYRGLNECHRDPEIVSNTHLVLAQPKAVKLLAYTTDDLKMKKKKYKHCNSQPGNKGNVSEVNVIVLCVYSWNYILGFSADTSQWSKCWVSLVPIRLYGTGRRHVFR